MGRHPLQTKIISAGQAYACLISLISMVYTSL